MRNSFVGYQGSSDNYRIYDPEKRKISVVATVTFNEEEGDFEFSTKSKGDILDIESVSSDDEICKQTPVTVGDMYEKSPDKASIRNESPVFRDRNQL